MSDATAHPAANAHRTGRLGLRRLLPTVGLVCCAGALIACSSTPSTGTTASSAASSSAAAASSTAGSYPAGKEQLCQARDQLKTSISALTNPALLTGGADGIKSALQQVQTDLQGIVAAGRTDYQPQIDAVQTSLKNVQTAVGELGNGGGAQNVLAVGSAVAATGTAATALFNELTAACGA